MMASSYIIHAAWPITSRSFTINGYYYSSQSVTRCNSSWMTATRFIISSPESSLLREQSVGGDLSFLFLFLQHNFSLLWHCNAFGQLRGFYANEGPKVRNFLFSLLYLCFPFFCKSVQLSLLPFIQVCHDWQVENWRIFCTAYLLGFQRITPIKLLNPASLHFTFSIQLSFSVCTLTYILMWL